MRTQTMHGGGMDDQINFCPEYFGQKKLADAIKDASSNEAKADHIFMYLNRGISLSFLCQGQC